MSRLDAVYACPGWMQFMHVPVGCSLCMSRVDAVYACPGWMQFMHVPDERSLFMLLMDGVRIGVHAALTTALHSRCMAKPVKVCTSLQMTR